MRVPPALTAVLLSTTRLATPSLAISQKPATAYFQPLQKNDVLHSTYSHKATCAAAATLVLANTAKLAATVVTATVATATTSMPECGLKILLSCVAGYEFADFGSGVYHWAMDNYGNKDTPIFGKQIEAFQGHHERPWTITHRQTCNNLHQPAIATMPFLAFYLVFVKSVNALAFGLVAMTFIMTSQELHKWSHTLISELPTIPRTLQKCKLIVAPRDHLQHHRPPFDRNYCIVSGHMNKPLTKMAFFSR